MADNDELNKGKKILEEQVEVAGHLDNAFKSIAANMAVAFEEVIDGMRGVDEIGKKIAKSYERDIVSSIRKMSGGLENQLGLQLKIQKGQNVSKEIEEQINKAKVRSQLTSEKITRAEGLGVEEKRKLKQQLDGQLTQELKALNILKNNNTEKQKTRGFGIEIAEGLGDQVNKLDKSGTLSSILKGDFQGIAGSLKLAQAFLAGVVKALIAGNKSVTALQRDLGTSGVEATVIRAELSGAAFAANDLRVTTEGLLKANKALNSEYQTAAVFNKDILVGATSALDAQIMSGEAISQLSGDAARLGQTFDESLKTQENAVNAINSQTGAQISLKTVLEASNRVSGQIRSQLGSNPEAIARAVTQAKALGFELEQIASSGQQLLQFESSIGAELEAELLTGKQLNLEKARLAALTGDYETLTSEIAANVGDFNDFSKMNVLQQQAIAAAVGMTADDLANSLVTEENREQLLKDAIASGNEQSVLNLKALDTQEKFAKVTEQVKGLIIDIAALFSPIVYAVGLIADGFGTMPGKIAGLIGGLLLIRKLSIGASISSIWQSFAKIPYGVGIPLAIAATAGLMGAISNATKADDMMYGNNMLVTKNKGAIALNNDDTIIAGTNLGGGSGRSSGISDEQIGKLASVINSKEVRFDSYSASGPQGIVNTERRQASNLFA
tara:strand:+ start:3002 stop:5014 length:2013 start_codon:yes stop_codon:yes gene_type:complete